MTTLREVAQKAGMAMTSVSEILRNKPGYNAATRRQVLRVARALNYRPSAAARQLRGGRSGVIGVVVGLDDPQVNLDRLAHVERLAFARGYRLLVGQVQAGDDKAERYLEDFAGRGVDGLLWLPQPFAGSCRMASGFLDRLGFVVALDEPLMPRGGCVRVDYGAGIQQAVMHLHARGRRRIGLALAGAGRKGDPMQQRRQGFEQGLKDSGLAPFPGQVWVGDMVEQPNPALVGRALDQLLGQAKVDAVIASNDIWAAALMKALRARGLRVPYDVALVGFDNLNFAALLDPALTTVDQGHEEFAAQVLDLMERRPGQGSAKDGKKSRVITPRLMVRESS